MVNKSKHKHIDTSVAGVREIVQRDVDSDTQYKCFGTGDLDIFLGINQLEQNMFGQNEYIFNAPGCMPFKLIQKNTKNTTESEITELFKRLQLGKKLNSPEKLHAMSGGLRDFVVDHLSKHKFFNKIVILENIK